MPQHFKVKKVEVDPMGRVAFTHDPKKVYQPEEAAHIKDSAFRANMALSRFHKYRVDLLARENGVVMDTLDQILQDNREDFKPQSGEKPQGFWNPTVTHKIDGVSDEKLNGAFDTLSKLGELTDPSVISSIKSLAGASDAVRENYAQVLSNLPPILAMTFTGYMAITRKSVMWAALFGASGMTLAAVNAGFSAIVQKQFDKLVVMFSNFTDTEDENFTPQSGFSCGDLEPLSVLLFSYLSTTVAPTRNPEPYALSFLKSAAGWDKRKENVSSVCQSVLELLLKALNFIREKVFGMDKLQMYSSMEADLSHWCDEVNEVAKESYDKGLLVDYKNSAKIWRLRMTASSLIARKYPTPALANSVRTTIQHHMHCLNKVAVPFDSLHGVGTGPRVEPFAIMFVGKPGVGKTTNMIPFINAVAVEILDKDEASHFAKHWCDYVYTRQTEHVYHEGYHGQIIKLLDDKWNSRDVAGNPDNEYTEDIRGISGFPNVLHMASMEKKANTYDIAELWVGTTMATHMRPQSINQPEAVMRRWTFILQTVKPEFATDETEFLAPIHRIPDYEKIKGRSFDLEASEFYPMSDLNTITGAMMNFQQIVDFTIEKVKYNRMKFGNYMDWVRDDYAVRFEQRFAEKLPGGFPGDDVPQSGEVHKAPEKRKTDTDKKSETDELTEVDVIVSDNKANEADEKRDQVDLHDDKDLQEMLDGVDIFEQPDVLKRKKVREDRRSLFFDLNLRFGDEMKDFNKFLGELFVKWKYRTNQFLYDRFQILIKIKEVIPEMWDRAVVKGYEFWKRFILAYMDSKNFSMQFGKVAKDVARISGREYGKLVVFKNKAMKVFENILSKIRLWVKNNKGLAFVLTGVAIIPIVLVGVKAVSSFSAFCFKKTFPGTYATIKDANISYSEIEERKTLTKFCEKENIAKYRIINRGSRISTTCWIQLSMLPLYQRHHDVEPIEARDASKFDVENQIPGEFSKTNEQGELERIPLVDGRVDKEAFESFWASEEPFVTRGVNKPEKYDIEGRSKSGSRVLRSANLARTIAKNLPNVCDQALVQVSNKVAKENMYGFHILTNDVDRESVYYGEVVFVRDRFMLMPEHFLKFCTMRLSRGLSDVNTKIVLEHFDIEKNITVKMSEIFDYVRTDVFNGSDLVLVQMPSRIQPHKDIVKHFVSSKIVFDGVVYFTALVMVNSGVIEKVFSEAYLQHHHRVDMTSYRAESYVINHGFTYKKNTREGDCGALLFLMQNSTNEGRIMGMHVSGQEVGSSGFSTLITKEMLTEALGFSKPQSFDYKLRVSQCKPTEDIPMPLYSTPLTVSLSQKTRIRKSPLWESWGAAKTRPAALTPGYTVDNVWRDPVMASLRKFHKSKPNLDKKLMWKVSKMWFSEMFNMCIHRGVPKIVSFDDAILGKDGVSFFDAIPRNTSAGYPFSQMLRYGCKGKETFFGSGEIYDLSSEECQMLRQRVACQQERMGEGKEVLFVFTVFPKDERKKHAKVDKLETRTIQGCPLDMMVGMRMYFLEFFVWFSSNRIWNDSAVGVNPYSHEWDDIGKKLSAKGPLVFAGDYVGFDYTFMTSLMLSILDNFIQPFYNDGHTAHKIRRAYLMSIVEANVILKDVIFKILDAFMSGAPGTAIFQTLHDGIYLRMAYEYLTEEKYPNSVFSEHVSCILFGDDHVVNVDTQMSDLFNQVTVAEVMDLKFHQGYTSDVKTDKNPPKTRNLSEISFLKRKFRFEQKIGRYIAPLDIDVILEMPYWTKPGILGETIVRDNVKTAVRELSMHEDEVYYKWTSIIQEACRKILNWQVYVPDRETMLCEITSLDYYL